MTSKLSVFLMFLGFLQSPLAHGSGELKLPCGGIYKSCTEVLDLVKNKILSNAKSTAEALVERGVIPNAVQQGNGGSLFGEAPFPKEGVKTCPLFPFKVSYKKIVNPESSKSDETVGSTETYGCDKAVSKEQFLEKCGELKYAMYEGANGAAVAGGAPIAYSAAAQEVAGNVSIQGNTILLRLTSDKCNQDILKNKFQSQVSKMDTLVNKENLQSKCGNPGLSEKEKGLCSTKHFIQSGYMALNSAMAQMGACEVHDKAMKKYESYKTAFNAEFKKKTQSACAVRAARIPAGEQRKADMDSCYVESMHYRIKEEQRKIGGQGC